MQNPVRAMIVDEAENNLYSSARNYAGLKGLLVVVLIKMRTFFGPGARGDG
jgi:ribosomal protein L4